MSDCENAHSSGLLPEFARRQFESAGILDIAVRVSQGDQPTDEDIQRLAEAPLPLLAKLVSLQPEHRPCDCPAVDPVVYLPLVEWTKSAGLEVAIEKATDTIREAACQIVKLVERDARVQDFGDCVRTLHVVPDTRDDSISGVFKAVRETLAESLQDAGIRVVFSGPADPEAADESQAANTMRAIALARLTADDLEFRAPVGELGIKAAHVALSFGANHLGQVAVNEETAAALHIPTLAKLADALRYDSPTPV